MKAPIKYSSVCFRRNSSRTGRRITSTCIITRQRTSCAMTARYRRQVLMSLVHQLSYRSPGKVSNIGVTESWRGGSATTPSPSRVPRSLDTSTPLSLLRRGYSGTSTSTTITATPGCRRRRRRRRHLASVRHPSESLFLLRSFLFRLSPSWETRTHSLDRSLFSTLLQVDTLCSHTPPDERPPQSRVRLYSVRTIEFFIRCF